MKQTRLKVVLVAAELIMVFGILAAWLISPGLRSGRSLIVLFLYCFPSEFLVGLVPHEPVLIYYGEFYSALTVAFVSAAGTVLAEGINYTVIGFFGETSIMKTVVQKPSVRYLLRLFAKAPFAAIFLAALTPVPFFPLRFLASLGRYSPVRYLFAVFLARTPRFALLAAAGSIFHIAPGLLLAVFLIMILFVNLPLARNFLKRM